jgi:hypothetical protein
MGDGARGGVEVGGVGLVEEAAGGEGTGESGCLAEEGAAVAGLHRKKCRRLERRKQLENGGNAKAQGAGG